MEGPMPVTEKLDTFEIAVKNIASKIISEADQDAMKIKLFNFSGKPKPLKVKVVEK